MRTTIAVKYLDGVEFIVNKIKNNSDELGIISKEYYEAREEGYYAAHVYTKLQYEIPKFDLGTEVIENLMEIQITTQLQEIIRKLTHKYYEERREVLKPPGETKWQWNYNSEEFAANYLGHILHYLEGMIMEIREKQKGANNE